MLLDMYDAAYPVKPPGYKVTVFYIGSPGATPHVWTPGEIAQYSYSLKLPAYVPSWFHTGEWNVQADAEECLNELRLLGAPMGCTCALDFETEVNASYVETFNNLLLIAGYKTLIYGSQSSLFKNPKPSAGYWVANYNNGRQLTPGSIATQYAVFTTYDANVIDSSVPLWGAQLTEDTDMLLHSVTPSGTQNPGVWLLSGGLYVGIDEPATVTAYQAAGVQMVTIDIAMHERILAAQAAMVPTVPALTGTGNISGSVNFS
jgi:hypothetical protein